MSHHEELYKKDLENRFPSDTIVRVVTGSLVTYQRKNGSTVLTEFTAGDAETAVFELRRGLVGGEDVFPELTTQQRDALTNVEPSTPIINISVGRELEIFNGTNWVRPGGTTSHKAVDYGEMYQDNDTGDSIDATNKTWVTAVAGILDGNTLVTFANNALGDRLVCGVGAAGNYVLHFSSNFTVAGNIEVAAAIRKNGVALPHLKDGAQGIAGRKEGLRISGFVTLADNDYIDVHIVAVTPGNVVKVYQTNIHIYRLD